MMMAGHRIKCLLLVAMAVIFASGSIGAAYACYVPSPPPRPPAPSTRLDLKLSDQDERWRDGVSGTWTASNMAPGDEFAFDGCFVGLTADFPRKVDKGDVGISCQYNTWTAAQPDRMAKYLVITACTYSYTSNRQEWQINLLTGRATRVSPGRGSTSFNRDWQIQDADRDGKITFSDLKRKPLSNLPYLDGDKASFEMSVRFDKTAGNEFQGDTFNLTMIYTLTAS
jgi:hypothetical protein